MIGEWIAVNRKGDTVAYIIWVAAGLKRCLYDRRSASWGLRHVTDTSSLSENNTTMSTLPRSCSRCHTLPSRFSWHYQQQQDITPLSTTGKLHHRLTPKWPPRLSTCIDTYTQSDINTVSLLSQYRDNTDILPTFHNKFTSDDSKNYV